MNPIVKAKLKKDHHSTLGWITYWLVDDKDRLLNTGPVCIVPEKYHTWFEKYLETVETDYIGLLENEILVKNS